MREPVPTWYFALVIVRDGDRFALVQEAKHGQRWYLPAGRVEPGESIVQGALRETREEAGLEIVLDGILRVEHTPLTTGSARCRVFFTAHPQPGSRLKQHADEHSLTAAWVTLDELSRYPLRGSEVADILRHLGHGGTVFPLGILAEEGAPFV
jgi:phosphatase NudJ